MGELLAPLTSLGGIGVSRAYQEGPGRRPERYVPQGLIVHHGPGHRLWFEWGLSWADGLDPHTPLVPVEAPGGQARWYVGLGTGRLWAVERPWGPEALLNPGTELWAAPGARQTVEAARQRLGLAPVSVGQHAHQAEQDRVMLDHLVPWMRYDVLRALLGPAYRPDGARLAASVVRQLLQSPDRGLRLATLAALGGATREPAEPAPGSPPTTS